MKKIWLILMALIIVGCTPTEGNYITDAYLKCQDHGGVVHIGGLRSNAWVRCVDGSLFQPIGKGE
jgi:hypothetical protein